MCAGPSLCPSPALSTRTRVGKAAGRRHDAPQREDVESSSDVSLEITLHSVAFAMVQINVPYIIIILCYVSEMGESIPSKHPKTSMGNFKHHTYEEMSNFLKRTAEKYPDFTNLYSIGNSVLNKTLWVLEMTAAPKTKVGIPNVKLIGNIHGNEPVGKELIMLLAEHMLSQYQSNERIRWLMDNTRIHLLPCANPDGFEKAQVNCGELYGSRNNVRGVDINTNFPEIFGGNRIPRQEETLAIMKWLNEVPFVLSGSLHSGTLVVTYPFDSKPHSITEGPSLTPDNDVFKYLASLYSSTHPKMHKSSQCPGIQKKFYNGTINGGEWLNKAGTMQDYNYVFHGCMELSLVISCCRYPRSEELSLYWEENREALLKFLSNVHMGVKGIVSNKITNETIPNVKLIISGRNPFNSTVRGEYWRILLPGKYIIQASAAGYHTKIVSFQVRESTTDLLRTTELNITMQPCPVNLNNSQNGTCDEMYKKKEQDEQPPEKKTESFHIDYQITLPPLYDPQSDKQDHQENTLMTRDNASEEYINWIIISFMAGISVSQFIIHSWKITFR